MMTSSEIRKKVANSELKYWYENRILQFRDGLTSEQYNVSGITAIYQFLTEQIEGCRKLESLPPFLQRSTSIYEALAQAIENVINEYAHQTSQANPDYDWNHQFLRQVQEPLFDYKTAKANFLIRINQNKPSAYQGAYNFFINQYQIGSKADFEGFLLAYEFENVQQSAIFNRRRIESAGLKSTREEVSKFLNEIEAQQVELLAHSKSISEANAKQLDELHALKKDLIESWFTDIQSQHHKIVSDASVKLKELEHTYSELLRLKKPAAYWNDRAEKLKKEGWRAVHWLVGLLAFGVITLYLLLWLTPDGMLLSFIKGKEQAIKWSVVYVTFLSFLAYGIRALNKIAFSSFHLARDAEEREQLTYVYLSLINDSTVDEKDKTLIMQSLFSRAETGLLKDESGPTMPSDVTNKIFSGK